MTQGELDRLTSQLGVLRQVARDYQGRTIDNIIKQMEEIEKEARG